MKTNKYGLVPCKFLKPLEIYPIGQIAGFVPKIAAQLRDREFVEILDVPDADAAVVETAASPDAIAVLAAAKAKQELKASTAPVAANAEPAEVAQTEIEPGADAGNGSQTGDIKVMGADDEVVIPAGWSYLHHTQIKSLARNITGEEPADKAAAIAVITKALEARPAE